MISFAELLEFPHTVLEIVLLCLGVHEMDPSRYTYIWLLVFVVAAAASVFSLFRLFFFALLYVRCAQLL